MDTWMQTSSVTLQSAILTGFKEICKHNGNKKPQTKQTKPPQNLRLLSSDITSTQNYHII